MEVYGIYEVGGSQPLYIGSTQSPLSLRFRHHLNNKAPSLRTSLFDLHRSGEMVLEIRSISKHESRVDMLEAEKELIQKMLPVYNSNGVYRIKTRLRKEGTFKALRAKLNSKAA